VARVRIATTGDLPPGTGTSVEAGGRTLALFNVDGTLYAVDDTCAHRGGPLGEGDLEGPIVTCPWHGWRYDVRTGVHDGSPAVRVACYPVTVEDGVAYVDI
jgi:nitrite reductase (NADH) small subunit/3-phenylpropionate/trans-cinnamate dioxygenase ferredoxin subunit